MEAGFLCPGKERSSSRHSDTKTYGDKSKKTNIAAQMLMEDTGTQLNRGP